MADLFDRVRQLLPKRGLLASPVVQRVFLGVLVVAVAAFPLVVTTPPFDLVEGAPSPRTVRAPRAVQYTDEAATTEARDAASAAVEPVMVLDKDALPEARKAVAGFFETALTVRRGFETSAGVKPGAVPGIDAGVTAELERAYPTLDTKVLGTAGSLDDATLARVSSAATQLITTVMSRKLTPADVAEAEESVGVSAQQLPFDAATRQLVTAVVSNAIAPTLNTEPTATEAARKAAADAVEPVIVARQAGENIVVAGEIVNATDLEIIRRLGMLDQSGSAISLAALVALCAIMVFAIGTYLWRHNPRVWASLRDLSIMAALFVGMIWLSRAVLWWRPDISVYLLPVPMAAMLAALLIGPREGVIVAVMTSLGGVMLGFSSADAVVASIAWSLAAVVAVSFMTDRRRLFYAGGALIATGAALAFLGGLTSGLSLAEAVRSAGYGAIGGTLSAILGYGMLPFFEYLFGVTTDIRLLELGNPSHPLLRRLMVEAPGTYSHSVMTGNLAEAGAEAVGANALLARVGAYYHDVGKLKRPGFFVENQAGGENPHDGTAPHLSALIITAHVREGVELAREYKLPREVVEIIKQHHGTSLVSYFYNKAAEDDDMVLEADFRYDGERPQSPEAAVVMLADSCEAAVRAVKKPTTTRIESAVRRVVDGKLADGQLDHADLTLAQIESIVQVYARMLSSVYHPRVEYPTAIGRKGEHAQHSAYEPSRP